MKVARNLMMTMLSITLLSGCVAINKALHGSVYAQPKPVPADYATLRGHSSRTALMDWTNIGVTAIDGARIVYPFKWNDLIYDMPYPSGEHRFAVGISLNGRGLSACPCAAHDELTLTLQSAGRYEVGFEQNGYKVKFVVKEVSTGKVVLVSPERELRPLSGGGYISGSAYIQR